MEQVVAPAVVPVHVAAADDAERPLTLVAVKKPQGASVPAAVT